MKFNDKSKSLLLHFAVVTCIGLPLGARDSTGRLEDPRVVINNILENSMARERDVVDSLSETGRFMQANRATAGVLESIASRNFEEAARMVLEGREARLPEFYVKQAEFYEQQVASASSDSSNAIRHLGKRPQTPSQDTRPDLTEFNSLASGPGAFDVSQLRERMDSLNLDANAYAKELAKMLPELAPELASEWDPNQLIEVAMNSQLESMEYAYYARIARLNALLWEKFPMIVKRRALDEATGGRPQNTADVINRGNQLKIQFPQNR